MKLSWFCPIPCCWPTAWLPEGCRTPPEEPIAPSHVAIVATTAHAVSSRIISAETASLPMEEQEASSVSEEEVADPERDRKLAVIRAQLAAAFPYSAVSRTSLVIPNVIRELD